MDKDQPITPEYLLAHGFVKYDSIEQYHIIEIPYSEGDIHYKELELHRQLCVVTFHPYIGKTSYNGEENAETGYMVDVYFQDDIGCGFVNIPFPWYELSVEYFESVYYGIRGHKPKLTIDNFVDTDCEIIQPKLIDNATDNK